MGVMDRRFSRASIPMSGDRCALVAVRQRETSVDDRPASVFRDEGGPTPAFSGAAGRRVNRHGHRHATTHKNRAQPRGRASGVRCKAMLGRSEGDDKNRLRLTLHNIFNKLAILCQCRNLNFIAFPKVSLGFAERITFKAIVSKFPVGLSS